MKPTFASEFRAAFKQGPRIFFAPLVGAFRGAMNAIRIESDRMSSENSSSDDPNSTFASEFMRAFKDGPRIYFAPLVGAYRGAIEAIRTESARMSRELSGERDAQQTVKVEGSSRT